ncbi:hypothetical protein VNO80_02268 [Phaseolus coccineus]|uniref:Uncharacterized protein n=1 Tax=Phaseolus coccineus TaxID=3886 RepID=A0AAN9RLB7_PHACN
MINNRAEAVKQVTVGDVMNSWPIDTFVLPLSVFHVAINIGMCAPTVLPGEGNSILVGKNLGRRNLIKKKTYMEVKITGRL